MIFINVYIQFCTRIRNFELRIRQKVTDPYGSGSTTMVVVILFTSSPGAIPVTYVETDHLFELGHHVSLVREPVVHEATQDLFHAMP
jgi:hypothetical protein